MDKVKRLNKIKSCILDMNNSTSFDYRDICKKHEVSVHVFTALKANATVTKVIGVGGYQYRWGSTSALLNLNTLAEYCDTFAHEKIKESQERVARRTPEQVALVKQRSDARKAAKEALKTAESTPTTPPVGSVIADTVQAVLDKHHSGISSKPEETKANETVKLFTAEDVLKIHNDIIRFGITEVEEYIKTR